MLNPSGHGSTIKAFRHGTHRSCPPEATIARLEPLKQALGITRVANMTGLDRIGVPVVMVCRPNARSSAVFHGKGIDLAAAKASGLMEAAETWHAEHVDQPLKLGSFAELRPRHRLTDIEALPRPSESRLAPDLPMLWVEGSELIAGEPIWLPFEVVHANATLREAPGSGCFSASTNGLASGNNLLEAISHGLCEIIERDATSLWNRLPPARQDATRIALDTVRDVDCRTLLDQVGAADLDVAVWDVTTDVGVPAVLCMIVDRRAEIAHIGRGAGCHPVREIAFLRAVTEAVQVRTTYIVGSREDIEYADYHWETLADRSRRARAMMGTEVPTRDFEATPSHDSSSFEDEVAWILDQLQAAGIRQAAAVDLSRSEIGIPVVRVVVPGLEGSDHHSDYTPGRRARAVMAGGR
jgi:YcaO-like protein with predicted kinase domain